MTPQEKSKANYQKRKAYHQAYREKHKDKAQQYRDEHKAEAHEYKKKLYAENKEKFADENKQYYALNKEKVIAKTKEYCQNNKEKVNKYKLLYYINNHHKYVAASRKRKAARIQRTPGWLSESQLRMIECFYFEAKMLEVETGIKHHVDHIIPLQGKNVSGLHVPENLRVISAKDNLIKSNSYEC